MDKSNYYIKNGYVNQSANYTYSKEEGDLYWNDYRVFLSNFYQKDVYLYAKRLIKKNKINSVIDIGCGTGRKLMKIIYPVCNNVTGVDQKEAIDFCNTEYKDGKFIVDNLEEPRFDKMDKYDLIICADVIEHMTNPDSLLNIFKNISHKDTVIIVSTPERDLLRGKDNMGSPKPEHIREWNAKELETYIENSGFTVLDHKIVTSIGFSLDKRIRTIRRKARELSGTLKTTQLILFKKI